MGAGGDQAFSFVGVEAVAADLVGGQAHSDSISFATLAYLDRAVAEECEFVAPEVVFGNDLFDDHLL